LFLFYEKSSGLLYQELKKLLGDTAYWEKIIFCTYQERPTFEFLFDVADKVFPNAIVCVSNADIAVDESIKKINSDRLKDSFFAISRHEVDIDTKKSTGLILNQLGIPNTFSADMWVYAAPRQFKFKSDFPIGTFHCDSFMNYYIDKSGYKLFNPCLDVNLNHIHDPIFNSSEEKSIKQKEEINKKLQEEVAFNSGEYPLKGAKWGQLVDYDPEKTITGTVEWYNTLIKIELDADGSDLIQAFSAALIALETLTYINCSTSVWLMLPNIKLTNNVYKLVTEFIKRTKSPHLYLGIKGDNSAMNNSNVGVHTYVTSTNLITTITDLRNKNIAPIWGFINETYSFGELFGLDYDPNLIATYSSNNKDIITLNILRVLNFPQLEFLATLFDSSFLNQKYKAFSIDIQYLLNNGSKRIEQSAQPSLTFITSVFKGAEFMMGYLDNIAAAALEVNGEVIIIDANSPQNEFEIYQDFIKEHPELESIFTYKRLDKDPGLYNCWKIAIKESKADWVSNANLDDRRSPFQAKVLLENLKKYNQFSGAAAAIRATRARNTAWYHLTDNEYWFNNGFEQAITFDKLHAKDENGNVKSQNIMHCMPIWHKSLHDKYGYFNEEKYGTSADWAFWLECTQNGEEFCLVPQTLSQYYINEQSHNRINDPNGLKENQIVADYLGVNQIEFKQQ
jgi:hypothetical protein